MGLMGEQSPVCMGWEAPRRLAHLRPIHDDLKACLGKRHYEQRFHDCPFALRLAPPGTSKRLHSWTQKLATSVNERVVPPWLVMRILMCLEAPSATSSDHNSSVASGFRDQSHDFSTENG